MPFLIAAGFASSRTAVLSSTDTTAAKVHPAPQIRLPELRPSSDCLLSRISSGICDNVTRLHRLDLERLGRRADAECRLQDMLGDLKEQIAWKTSARTRSTCVDGSVELRYKAS